MRPYAAPIIDSTLLAAWRFGERLSWEDVSGHGLTLTPSSDPELHEDGAYFDGTSCAYCTLDLRPYSEITLEAWFRVASLPTSVVRLVSQSYNLYLQLYMGRLSGSARSVAGGGGGFYLHSAMDLVTAGAWHHVALTFRSNTANGAQLWYDGQLAASGTTYGLLDYNNTRLDVGSLEGNQRMTGWVDEVRIWSTVRDMSHPVRYGEGRRGVARGSGLEVLAGAIA
jgi:hypothetical protein